MVLAQLGAWTPTFKRMNVDPYFTPCTMINSKWLTDINIRVKTTKFWGDSTGVHLCDLWLGSDSLDTSLTAQTTKGKIDTLISSKWKVFVLQSTPSRKWKGNPQTGRKYLQIFSYIKSPTGDLCAEHIKNFANLAIKRQLKDISPKKIYGWLINPWNDTHHHQSWGKLKIKITMTIPHTLGQLKSKRQTITSVGEKTEHGKPYTSHWKFKMAQPLWKAFWQSLTPLWPIDSTRKYLSKKMKIFVCINTYT